MSQTFKMKVVAKRQVTVPTRLLELLHIHEGDYLEVVVESGKRELTLRGLALAPTSYFSDEVLKKLSAREADIRQGKYRELEDASKLPAARAKAAMRTARG